MSEPQRPGDAGHLALCAQVRKIEQELRRLGYLTGPVGEAQTVHTAFGLGEMPFEDWLTTVFLPRACEAAASDNWPAGSQVGVAAIRNFDGREECDALIGLLCELDWMITARQGSA